MTLLKLLRQRLKALVYAWRGLVVLIKNEAAIQVQLFISVLITLAGFYFDITKTEWLFQILTIGLVIGLEALNSSVEEIADFIHPDFHHKIGKIKDMAAGAVIVAGFMAVIVAVVIYLPYLFPGIF